MGSVYYPEELDIIEQKTVVIIVGEDALNKLKVTLGMFNANMDAFAFSVHHEDMCQTSDWGDYVSVEQDNALDEIWDEICAAFTKETDLMLDLVYVHDDDNGDLQEGWYFTVDGMYELSDAGKALYKYVEKGTSIQYG